MKSVYILVLICLSALLVKAQTETEPNNNFETANSTAANATMSASVAPTSDPNDYFVTVLPYDGTMKIYIKGTNNSASAGYLYMYGYDRRKASRQIFSEYIKSSNTAAGATIFDTLTIKGRAADTFYFR